MYFSVVKTNFFLAVVCMDVGDGGDRGVEHE